MSMCLFIYLLILNLINQNIENNFCTNIPFSFTENPFFMEHKQFLNPGYVPHTLEYRSRMVTMVTRAWVDRPLCGGHDGVVPMARGWPVSHR